MGIDPLNLAERALCHFREGSTDQSESLMKMPIDAYTDPDRYKREVNRIFLELPMAAALSIEIPNAGDYKAMTVSDVPILLVRGKIKSFELFSMSVGTAALNSALMAVGLRECFHALTTLGHMAILGN